MLECVCESCAARDVRDTSSSVPDESPPRLKLAAGLHADRLTLLVKGKVGLGGISSRVSRLESLDLKSTVLHDALDELAHSKRVALNAHNAHASKLSSCNDTDLKAHVQDVPWAAVHASVVTDLDLEQV